VVLVNGDLVAEVVVALFVVVVLDECSLVEAVLLTSVDGSFVVDPGTIVVVVIVAGDAEIDVRPSCVVVVELPYPTMVVDVYPSLVGHAGHEHVHDGASETVVDVLATVVVDVERTPRIIMLACGGW